MFVAVPVVMLRAPLSPLERTATGRDLTPGSALRAAAADPLLVEAIAVASPDLLDALGRADRPPSEGRPSRAAAAVAGYACRMRARATPFGLFAGVTVACCGQQ